MFVLLFLYATQAKTGGELRGCTSVQDISHPQQVWRQSGFKLPRGGCSTLVALSHLESITQKCDREVSTHLHAL